ncbi:unnamed protein product [Ectocarpus sp. 8 AP-2014]
MRFGHVRWADLRPSATRLQSSSDDDVNSGRPADANLGPSVDSFVRLAQGARGASRLRAATGDSEGARKTETTTRRGVWRHRGSSMYWSNSRLGLQLGRADAAEKKRNEMAERVAIYMCMWQNMACT